SLTELDNPHRQIGMDQVAGVAMFFRKSDGFLSAFDSLDKVSPFREAPGQKHTGDHRWLRNTGSPTEIGSLRRRDNSTEMVGPPVELTLAVECDTEIEPDGQLNPYVLQSGSHRECSFAYLNRSIMIRGNPKIMRKEGSDHGGAVSIAKSSC